MAIEFAAIFGLFFALVYGTIAFGLPAVARMGFQHYSVEASRAAVRVDPNVEKDVFLKRTGSQIDTLITESWLPAKWRDGCTDLADAGWTKLPNTDYGYYKTEPNPQATAIPRYQVNVCIQANTPIVPQLVLSEDLRFPPHEDANGNPWVRGYTITTF